MAEVVEVPSAPSDHLDPDDPDGRRHRRVRHRRHTRPMQSLAMFGAVVVVGLCAGLLYWRGYHLVRDSRVGRTVTAVRGDSVAVLPATPVVLLAQPAASGGLVAVTLLVLSPGGAGGYVVLMPSGTMAEVPEGPATLAQAWLAGGERRLTGAVEALFQVSVAETVVVDANRWTTLIQPLSPLQVDFASPVEVADGDGELTTLVDSGGAPVDATDVGRILEARSSQESELARLVRHEDLWRSLLAELGRRGATAADVPSAADDAATALALEDVLGGLAAGSSQVITLDPVSEAVTEAGETYQLDPVAVRLLAAQAMPGAVSPGSEGWKVRLVDGVGDPEAVRAAAAALVAGGANLVIASVEPNEVATTQVHFDPRVGGQGGVDVAGMLGVATSAVSTAEERIEGVDVTVVLGRDRQPVVAPTTTAAVDDQAGQGDDEEQAAVAADDRRGRVVA